MLAAARDPDPDVQAARLREWACSDDAPLMLDMRSADDFAAARLDGAVNIPFEDLDGRLHELPPRSKPLAVVLARAPSREEQARVFAADFKGLPWRVRAFFLPDPSLFDAHARAAGVDVRSGEVHPRDRGHLWEPSDMVARWLPRLEARMARAWNAEALLAARVPAVPVPVPVPAPQPATSRTSPAASVRGRGVRRGKGRGVGGDEGMARVGVRLGRARLGAMRRARRDARRVAARLSHPRRPPQDVPGGRPRHGVSRRRGARRALGRHERGCERERREPSSRGFESDLDRDGDPGACARFWRCDFCTARLFARFQRASRVGGGVLVSFHARRGAHGGGSTE